MVNLMNISRDKLGALFFFIFSVCYGYYATQIPLYPGEEYDVFTSQTMPKIYAVTAMIVSALALFLAIIEERKSVFLKAGDKDRPYFDRKGWTQCGALIGLMFFYGGTIEALGFILSTIVFLIIGYLILDERRPKILFVASVPVVIVFWAIMTQLLGIYLSTGDIWS